MKDKLYKIVSCIILSIVATAIWEKLISPYFDKLLDYLLSFGNNFTVYVSDLIYTRIAKGVYINIAYYIFIIIVSFVLAVCLIEILIVYFTEKFSKRNVKVIKEEKTSKHNSKFKLIISRSIKSYKFKIIFFTVYTSIIVLFYLIFLLTTNFINNSITSVTNNIEILSPYIDDYDYKMLKSKFYSMTSRKDYNNLMLMIDEYGNDFNVTLK